MGTNVKSSRALNTRDQELLTPKARRSANASSEAFREGSTLTLQFDFPNFSLTDTRFAILHPRLFAKFGQCQVVDRASAAQDKIMDPGKHQICQVQICNEAHA